MASVGSAIEKRLVRRSIGCWPKSANTTAMPTVAATAAMLAATSGRHSGPEKKGAKGAKRCQGCQGIDRLDGGDEAVTAAMDGLDVDRLSSVVAEGLAKQSDGFEQRGLRDEGVRPDRVHQLLLAPDDAGACDEGGEHAQRARRKRHFVFAPPQPIVRDEAEWPKPHEFSVSSVHLQDSSGAPLSF